MKKVIILLMATLMSFVLVGCSDDADDYSEDNKKYADDTTEYSIATFPYKLNQEDFVELYEEAMDGEREDFHYVNVDTEGIINITEFYKETKERTEYLYYGEMDDTLPDGEGVLFEKVSDCYLATYIGEFEDGAFNGDGIEIRYGLCNSIAYEGEFEDGEYSGYGIAYDDISDGQVKYVEYDTNPVNNVDGYDIMELPLLVSTVSYNGEHSKGIYDGDGVAYYSADKDGVLMYVGEQDEGKFDGDGVLYYSDGKTIMYEGEFSGGVFDGDGTLYNTDGSEKYDGEFSEGDYD